MEQYLTLAPKIIEDYFKESSLNNESLLNMFELYSNNTIDPVQGIMIVNDPLLKNNKSVNFRFYNPSSSFDNAITKPFSMILFFKEALIKSKKSVLNGIIGNNNYNPDTKIELIRKYQEDIKNLNIQKSLVFKLTKNAVAQDIVIFTEKKNHDLLEIYDFFSDTANFTSIEDIYINFTLWRLTRNKYDFDTLINRIDEYFKLNLYTYQNSPIANDLYKSIDNYSDEEKINLFIYRFIIIIELANQVFSKFYKFGWIKKFKNSFSLEACYTITKAHSKYAIMNSYLSFNDSKNAIDITGAINGYYQLIKALDLLQIIGDLSRLYDPSPLNNGYKLSMLLKQKLEELLFENKVDSNYSHINYNLDMIIQKEYSSEEIDSAMNSLIMFMNNIDSSDNIDILMNSKNKLLSSLDKYLSLNTKEELSNQLERVTKRIKDLLMYEEDFDAFLNSVTTSLKKYSSNLKKYRNIYDSLASAEMLYSIYIKNKQELDGFDYSCISIMYYMSLEEFANKLFYIPYKRDVLSNHISELKNSRDYLSDSRHYLSKNGLKNSCELGNIAHLLIDIFKTKKYKEYIMNHYNLNNAKLTQIKNVGYKILDKANSRNKAAHGGNNIGYNDVVNDKKCVYIAEIDGIHGLIEELLDILFN